MKKQAVSNKYQRNTAAYGGAAYLSADVRGMYGALRDERRAARTARGGRIAIDIPAGKVRTIGRALSLRGFILFLLAALTAGTAAILLFFRLEKATVYGNTKYSPEQIQSFVTRGTLGENTFIMALKYHHRKVEGIPFIDRIDIDLASPSTVRVNIIEKPLDGVIEGDGRNVFLSDRGIVQTVSGRSFADVTKIVGIGDLAASAEGDLVTAADEKGQMKLDLALELLQIMGKYEMHADSVEADENGNLTAALGHVRVKLGKSGYEQKIYRLHQISPCLEGKRGVISMAGSSYDGANIVLQPR